jgi:uncharacterized protein (DUF302 family)
MVRARQSFPETMLALQTAIAEHGYKVSRVQRVDIGLTKSGFKTDKYRIVFYGKAEEVARLTDKHPQLIPYLPLKIVVFAEGKDTLLVTGDPVDYLNYVDDPEVRVQLRRWLSDLHSIMAEMREER